MRSIGNLIFAEVGKYELLSGKFDTFEYSLSVELIELTQRHSERSPTHDVFTTTPDGRRVQVGSAWLNEAKAAHSRGKRFFSIVIDDPSFIRPLYLVAFPNADESEMSIHNSRSRGANAA